MPPSVSNNGKAGINQLRIHKMIQFSNSPCMALQRWYQLYNSYNIFEKNIAKLEILQQVKLLLMALASMFIYTIQTTLLSDFVVFSLVIFKIEFSIGMIQVKKQNDNNI